MDREGFRQFLRTRKLSENEIESSMAIAERLEQFACSDRPSAEQARAFSALLLREGLNSLSNYYALARYGRFGGNDPVYVAFLELLDGAEAMEGLHRKAAQVLGAARRDRLFDGIPLPPLGLPNRDKVEVTRKVMARLEAEATPEECRRILSDSLRDLEGANFDEEKRLYAECATLDEFLDRNAARYLAMLEQLKREGRLYFTQEITDAVLDFVRGEPQIVRGVREGDILYEVKIPHMTKEYLAETDERMRRYYYCHCPWVKEALRNGDAGISPTFCACSAGFSKKRWEAIFGQPLRAEVVESVLRGDRWCKIAIHLPGPAQP